MSRAMGRGVRVDSGQTSVELRLFLVLGLFFTSGMAGLIYQIVWSRLLSLVIGVSIFAITAVICTFMFGMALGSYVIGRRADRWGHPLRTYGILEAVIGVYALLTPWIFDLIQPVYAAAFGVFDRFGLNVFRIVLSTSVLLVPTVLMGGTLPVLSRAIVAKQAGAARGVGLLYSVNTLGAVAGCVAAGFALLASVGISGSIAIAAALNFAVAAVALFSARSGRWAPEEAADGSPTRPGFDSTERLVLGLFFLSGFAALGYEILWTRALLVHLKASTYAFSLMLSVYLLGVAGGSLMASGYAARSRRPLVGLAACQLGVVATVLLGLIAFPELKAIGLTIIGSRRIDVFGRAIGLMFAQASVVMLLPTLFMGAMFPFGVAAYHSASRSVSRSVGSLYAVNTAGNIAGAVVVGFGTIPIMGVRHSIIAMVAVNLAVAAVIALWLSRSLARRMLAVGASAAVLAAVHVSIDDEIFLQSFRKGKGARTTVLFYREGASDTVAVFEHWLGKEKARTLIYSDGRGAAGTGTLLWNLYFGHLPMVLHPDPQEVLHICYGSGNSVLALSRHKPRRIDVVELSPHVRDASRFFWSNEGVIDDPRVNLIIEDGRNYLLGTDRKYDVVSLEPPNVYTAGVVNLYTQEFYELVRQHLNPGGIFVQWLPTSQLSEADRGHLIRAFVEALPYAYTWQQLIGPSLLLMGTLEPLSVNLEDVERKLRSDWMRRDVETMNTRTAESFMSFFLLGDAATRELAADYEPVRDDRTIVDYTIPRYVGSGYGLSFYSYAIGSRVHNPNSVSFAKTREYAEWADAASLIVPDPEQAERVERAILKRREAGRIMSGSR
jgi:spermidine synthase